MSPSLLPCPVLTVIYLLLPALRTQEIQVSPKVWGHVGQGEVILPCRFIQGPAKGTVTQLQWDLKGANSTRTDTVLVHLVDMDKTKITEKYLGKVELREFSLVIKNAEVVDSGEYTCVLATFPSGSFKDTTRLYISDGGVESKDDREAQMPLSAGAVSAIVISVLLLLAIAAATVYLVVIRRRRHSSRNPVTIDTTGWDPSMPSFIKREDVVYADVTVRQPSNQARVNSSEEQVMYSEVRVNGRTSDEALHYLAVEV